MAPNNLVDDSSSIVPDHTESEQTATVMDMDSNNDDIIFRSLKARNGYLRRLHRQLVPEHFPPKKALSPSKKRSASAKAAKPPGKKAKLKLWYKSLQQSIAPVKDGVSEEKVDDAPDSGQVLERERERGEWCPRYHCLPRLSNKKNS